MAMGRIGALIWAFALLVLLTGCANTPGSPVALGSASDSWTGRLAIRVDTEPPSSLAGGFELRGRPEAGELTLSTPFGGTLAVLAWMPGQAILRSGNEVRNFDSLDALVVHATGTAVPVAALFEWLAGSPTRAAGWHADLSRLNEGRLVARRLSPLPVAELHLVLDR